MFTHARRLSGGDTSTADDCSSALDHRTRRQRCAHLAPEGSSLVPAGEVVDLGDLARHPRQHECRSDEEEQRQDEPVRQAVEVAGDLPDLGVDEEERDEQQEQGKRLDDEPAEVGDLFSQLTERPSGHRDQPVARDDIDHQQNPDAGQHRLKGVAGLAEEQRWQRRPDDEEGQLARPDGTRDRQALPAAQDVGGHDPGEQDSERDRRHHDVASDAPLVEVQGVEAPGEVGDPEDGQRPGPDVGAGRVPVDEVRKSALDEPALDLLTFDGSGSHRAGDVTAHAPAAIGRRA